MKSKFNDNKLAEEFDLIILTDDALEKIGLPQGSLGTLTYSYTGGSNPLYAEFAFADGSRREERLSLQAFRVLDVRSPEDLSLVRAYLRRNTRKKA